MQGFKTYAIKPSSRSLDKLSKRVSLWGDLSRALLETNKGINFSRTDLKTESVQNIYIYIYKPFFIKTPY
jgi:hypothetical protein